MELRLLVYYINILYRIKHIKENDCFENNLRQDYWIIKK